MPYSPTTSEFDESVIGPIKKAMEENAYEIVKGEMEFVYDCKYGPSWGNSKKYKEN